MDCAELILRPISVHGMKRRRDNESSRVLTPAEELKIKFTTVSDTPEQQNAVRESQAKWREQLLAQHALSANTYVAAMWVPQHRMARVIYSKGRKWATIFGHSEPTLRTQDDGTCVYLP